MTDTDTGLQPTTRIELVATELRSIWERTGRLIPEDIVAEAETPEHPLHEMFVWDNDEAAHRYRVWQAGQLIRSVKITVAAGTNGEIEDFAIRAWLPARSAGAGHGYVPQEQIAHNPAQRDRLLRQMQRELAAFRRRYAHLDAFWREITQLAAERTEQQAS